MRSLSNHHRRDCGKWKIRTDQGDSRRKKKRHHQFIEPPLNSMNMKNKWIWFLMGGLFFIGGKICAQEKALTNTSQSSFARLHSLDMGDVKWTTGFWAERFRVCKDSMI